MTLTDRTQEARETKKRFRAAHFAIDVLLLNLAFHLAFYLRFRTTLLENDISAVGAPSSLYLTLEAVTAAGWIVLSLIAGLYSNAPRRSTNISMVVRSLALVGVVVLLLIVAQGGYNFYSRLFLLYFFTLAAFFFVASYLISSSGRFFIPEERNILIIGAGRAGERFYHNVEHDRSLGYKVIGFLDDNSVESNVREMILGEITDIEKIAEGQKIDEVIIALPKTSEQSLAELVETCENKLIRVNVIPNDYAALEGKRVVEQVGEFSLVRLREAPLDAPLNKALKRAFDIFFSLLVLVLVFPVVFAVCGIIIKLSSRGPLFFKQLRTGEDGRDFTCFKFRTMRHAPPESTDSFQTLPGDPRLTGIGKFMRRTNLDELPQFWNVLAADMSVVGPRPHPLKHTENYKRLINNYMLRHFVKPGVTGWAQVNGLRGATETPEKMDRRIRFDIFYIDNWSFSFDLYIIWLTVLSMLRGDKNAY